MRLSNELINRLQVILKEEFDLEYTDEKAQEAGMAIMRFVLTKAQRQQELNKRKEHEDEQP